jgi:hypothetical protein
MSDDLLEIYLTAPPGLGLVAQLKTFAKVQILPPQPHSTSHHAVWRGFECGCFVGLTGFAHPRL